MPTAIVEKEDILAMINRKVGIDATEIVSMKSLISGKLEIYWK